MDHLLNTASVAAWRKTMRADLLRARLALAPELHRQFSRRVLDCLVDGFRQQGSGTIGLYFPIRGEINLIPFARQVYEWGGSVSLPVVVAKGQPLEFRAWKPGDDMEKGKLNIPFPTRGERVNPETLIIPLVGFDAACFRLGYGAGYYDYTLQSALSKSTTIGVGFELSRLDSVYPQPHDAQLDFIITEKGLQTRP